MYINYYINLVFTMSAPSTTASQTEFCNAMSNVRMTSEPASGYDTPMPDTRISEETLKTLNAVKEQLEQPMSSRNKPPKRKRVHSPNQIWTIKINVLFMYIYPT